MAAMLYKLFSQSPKHPLCLTSCAPPEMNECLLHKQENRMSSVYCGQIQIVCFRKAVSESDSHANAHVWNWHMQVEGLEEVERAFVHVDYALRAEPEHKVRLKCSGASCL